MKKIIALVMLLAFTMLFGSNALAMDLKVMPKYNNTLYTESDFVIDSNGIAKISIRYFGYSELTQYATVNIKLQKRFLLVFWNDVAEWNESSVNSNDWFKFERSVEKGVYRAIIELHIYGSGGSTDVITEELQYKY